MSGHKTKQRMMAMVLSAIMVVGVMPVSALAEAGTFPIGTSGVITAIETLGPDIAIRSVPIGTSERDLELPDTLTATIRLIALEEEPEDSGETDAKLHSADLVSGPGAGADEIDDIETDEENEIASPSSDTKEAGDRYKAEPTEETVDSTDEMTALLPVTWACAPEYDGETTGTYLFTPELPEGLALADGVETPMITVTIAAATVTTGTVTAFQELPEDIRWQNTTAPEFPETVGGAVEGETIPIPVTWEADHEYDAEYPVRGLYVFTADLGEGYSVADDIELPRITVFIPQTVGKRMARMAGGGTKDRPLEITTAAQLSEIAALVNARASGLELFLFNDANAKVSLKLINDIDLSAYTQDGGWVTIGSASNPFISAFDGGGHTISNLTIDRADGEYQGLFGQIGPGSLVENLGIENAAITAKQYVGGIAGEIHDGTVKNCYSDGVISGLENVGGVVGYGPKATVQNCYSTGSINGTCNYVGGVVGQVSNGLVQNCAALNFSVGGPEQVGRVAGHNDNSTLSGNIAFDGMTLTQNGSAKTPVEGENQVDGESKTAADIRAEGFFETLFHHDEAWTYAAGKLPGFGAAIDMPDPNFRGAGTSENPYQITAPAQLARLAELVNARNASYNAAYYKLMNNLDLSDYGEDYDSGKGFMPIGNYEQPFRGIFDGNGKTITGLYIYRNEQEYVGLFGSIVSGTVKNLVLQNVSVKGSRIVGGVTGSVYSSGIVQGCSSSGTIRGGDYTGSVVGFVHVGTVENCYSAGSVTGKTYVGGVVGQNSFGTVKNCYSTGSVMPALPV